MASSLAFNKAIIGAVTIDTDEFVNGSGVYTETGYDTSVSTADGKRHYVRRAIDKRASFSLYGDRTDLRSAGGSGTTVADGTADKIELYLGTTKITPSGMTGKVTRAVYSEQTMTTELEISCDPTAT